MNRQLQRDLFLVLTIVGLFVTFVTIVFGAFDAALVADDLAAAIKARDIRWLKDWVTKDWPVSLLFGGVAIAAFFCYRRYQKLLAYQTP